MVNWLWCGGGSWFVFEKNRLCVFFSSTKLSKKIWFVYISTFNTQKTDERFVYFMQKLHEILIKSQFFFRLRRPIKLFQWNLSEFWFTCILLTKYQNSKNLHFVLISKCKNFEKFALCYFVENHSWPPLTQSQFTFP